MTDPITKAIDYHNFIADALLAYSDDVDDMVTRHKVNRAIRHIEIATRNIEYVIKIVDELDKTDKADEIERETDDQA